MNVKQELKQIRQRMLENMMEIKAVYNSGDIEKATQMMAERQQLLDKHDEIFMRSISRPVKK